MAKRNTLNEAAQRVVSEFPKHSLEASIRVPAAIEEANGGKPFPPTDLAIALNISPGSSDFRVLLSSSYKYGLTVGTYKSTRVSITDRGTRIAAPVGEADRKGALVEAALAPETFRGLYDFFRGKKLPEEAFFQNTAVREFNVPREHAARCVQIFQSNMEFAGLVRKASSGLWLSSDAVADESAAVQSHDAAPAELDDAEVTDAPNNGQRRDLQPVVQTPAIARSSNRVFISHGKNKEIVEQLKDIVRFGKFDPVIAIENETPSVPVPEKVLQDMRSCFAGIIHVAGERVVADGDGKPFRILNENVLIEIGAAMALFGRNFILLVEDGQQVPSNLQGLYQCRYTGNKLDGEATMKLLKAFNGFQQT